MNGSAFSTYAIVPKQFVTLTGQENIIEFQVEEGTSKHCCKKCGSPLFNLNSQYPKYAMVYLGSLDNNTIEPTHNIYCANMLAWVEHIAPIQKWDQAITKKTL